MRQPTRRHSHNTTSKIRLILEQLESRELFSVIPSTNELTEGNATAWSAFATSATATATNDVSYVKVGSQSLKLATSGGADAGIKIAAPAGNWNLTGYNRIDFWVYGENKHSMGWQGAQPIIKLISTNGSLQLTPTKQLMPMNDWAQLSAPFAGDENWKATSQGTFDLYDVTMLEIHQDTWDFGFSAYYDGVAFAQRGVLESNVLGAPRGVATDSQNRVLVVEGSANRVRILNSTGDGLQLVGLQGTDNGQFMQPNDIAVNSQDQFYVADTGNDRIQIFNADGTFAAKFGSTGTAPGQFQDPYGIEYDKTSNRLYVTDAVNHTVQRFFTDGKLDTNWASGGVLGTVGVAQHDHTGFDSPHDVGVNPVTGQIYVADFNNQRLEVYSASGVYVRTYLGVYRPVALAFDSNGNLYIAGRDPDAVTTRYGGRLRLLKTGDELISQHYTGGDDDLNRSLNGVAMRSDGKIIFSDTLNSRLVKVSPKFQVPIENIQVEPHGTSVTFTWTTSTPSSSSIRIGSGADKLTRVVTDPLVTQTHAITVDNLTPNTRQFYSVSFRDTFTQDEIFTTPDVINTGVEAGQTSFARAKSVGLVYTDGQDGTGYTRRAETQIDAMKARFQTIADFYWRNSGFKLWIDFTVIESDRDLSAGTNMFAFIDEELQAAGFTAADDIDGVYQVTPFAEANLGGGDSAFGRLINSAEWNSQTDGVAIHEVNHSIDNMYHFSDLPKYQFNHGIWAIQGSLGGFYSANAQILRNMLPANLTAIGHQYKKVVSAPDADNDSFPDSSPAGLSTPLSITEAIFGSSPTKADTDGDGLSDLQEAQALVNGATNPNQVDSDGDGIRDGVDLNPSYKMNELVHRGSPTMDGILLPSEGWSVLTDNWGYENHSLVTDDNDRASSSTTYAAWDNNYFYVALRGPQGITSVTLNGNDSSNYSIGSADYRLTFSNSTSLSKVKVNVAVPDLIRQYDDYGEASGFFDTDAIFTKPYLGRPINKNPGDGLGFSGRLVTEADITYQYQVNANNSVWEARIPWSQVTQFRGAEGKEFGISFNSDGDKFFALDELARIRLVAAGASKPIVNFGNTLVTYQENANSIFVAPSGVVRDHDSYDLNGGILQIKFASGGTSTDRLWLKSAGLAARQISTSSGKVLYGGVVVGKIGGGTGTNPLKITFNTQATPAIAQAILRSVSYRAAGDSLASSSRTLQATLSDGDGQASLVATTKIQVNARNDAPKLNSSSVVTFPSINEDVTNPSGTLVSTLLNGAISDADPNALRGIAIASATGATQGTWQYSLDAGSHWEPLGTVSKNAALLLPANANSRIRFVPQPNFNGAVKITYWAWDQTQGSPGNKFNITTPGVQGNQGSVSWQWDEALLSILPVNDAPVLDASKTPVLSSVFLNASNPNGTLVKYLITDAVTDVDAGAVKGIAVSSASNVQGTWQFSLNNGVNWQALGTVSPSKARLLAADNSTRLRFIPRNGFLGKVSLTFYAWDQTRGAAGVLLDLQASGVSGGTGSISQNWDTATLSVVKKT